MQNAQRLKMTECAALFDQRDAADPRLLAAKQGRNPPAAEGSAEMTVRLDV